MAKLSDGIAFMAMASFWAVNYPFVKIALGYEPPMMVLLFRVIFALVFSFAIFFRIMKIPKDFKTHLKIFLFSLLNITIFMGLWFTGEQSVSASLSSLIIYSYPILMLVFSFLIIGEKLDIYKIAGTALGFAGLITIFADQIYIKPGIGLFLLLIAAVCWSLSTIYFKKYLSIGTDVFAVNSLQFAYALPVIALWAFLDGTFSFSGLNAVFILVTLFMGSLGTAVAYFIFLFLFRKYRVSSISGLFFTVPALSVLFSYLILGEVNTYFTYLGLVMISIGIYLTARKSREAGNKAINDSDPD
ncbi:DMT family transporter [Oxyplasma meridianum]|uniref:DMT family transporter n=1 Tax=Oxyplasma meridianum TaxID=3073602 RepID=A0AAX4NI82_9ARCH